MDFSYRNIKYYYDHCMIFFVTTLPPKKWLEHDLFYHSISNIFILFIWFFLAEDQNEVHIQTGY